MNIEAIRSGMKFLDELAEQIWQDAQGKDPAEYREAMDEIDRVDHHWANLYELRLRLEQRAANRRMKEMVKA